MGFIFRLVPLATTAVLLLAACGSTADPTPTAPPTATPPMVAQPTSTPTPDGKANGRLDLNALLTIADVEASLPELSSLTTAVIDYYAMIEAPNPEQVVGMNSFAGLVFQSSGTASVTLAVVDFENAALAEAHLTTSSPGLELTDIEGSDDSYAAQGGDLIAILSRSGNYVVSINGSGLPETDAELEAGTKLLALALSRLP
ncbi:MAG: hypothetical protein O2826_10130 [Chloroflexi bacterium]|nr:hypothetical protein [Chloroflexota bacterium]MDA1174862.1 hypothetical protein [Chloroflexota bacterium]